MKRFCASDATHGQAQTGFVHSLLTITQPRLLRDAADSSWKVILLSNREEGLLFAAARDSLGRFEIFYEVGERFVEITVFRKAIERCEFNLQEVLLLFAISSCSECPSTKHLKQKAYVKAFVRYYRHIGKIEDSVFTGLLAHNLVQRFLYPIKFGTLERLVAIAYYLDREKSSDVSLFLATLEKKGMAHDSWAHIVRVMISTSLLKEGCATYLMPEVQDLELQFRSAIATVG